MATVGQQLTTPESGWRRYTQSDSRFLYIGTGWSYNSSDSLWINNDKYQAISITDTNSVYIKFKFYGSKIRVLSTRYSGMPNKINIIIDGVAEQFSLAGSNQVATLIYEKLDLTLEMHEVKVMLDSECSPKNLYWDCIDIDDTGYLVHPTLNQVSSLLNMQIGDCIPCRYTALTSGVAGYFSELGTCIANEIPITGSATPDGLFYLIKSDKGTLISDRVIQTNISWDVLNAARFIEGNMVVESEKSLIPKMFSNVNSNIIVSASSEYNTSYSAYKAFNRILNNEGWISNGRTGFLKVDLFNGFIAKYYSVTYERTELTGSPNTWTFQGSNDNSTWETLDTRTGETTWYYREKKCYKLSNTKSFRYYRINVTANNGLVWMGIGELGIYDSSITPYFIRSLSGGVVYADIDGNPIATNYNSKAFPLNNEWDKYIVGSDLEEKIIPGDNTIWNATPYSWCKETVSISLGVSSQKSNRGVLGTGWAVGTTVGATLGFRPVLNYIESDVANDFIY